jgi:hypothetical protein
MMGLSEIFLHYPGEKLKINELSKMFHFEFALLNVPYNGLGVVRTYTLICQCAELQVGGESFYKSHIVTSHRFSRQSIFSREN